MNLARSTAASAPRQKMPWPRPASLRLMKTQYSIISNNSCARSSRANSRVEIRPTKGAKMREINHNNLNYGGGAQETASIRVEANGTNHMVNYVLDGSPAQTLP